MNKRSFFLGCLLFHIAFAFFQIYKQTALVKLAYKKQKDQAHLLQLGRQKAQLTHEREALKSKTYIKQFAQKELSMEKLRLENIKRVDNA